jgi:hypothetical protein
MYIHLDIYTLKHTHTQTDIYTLKHTHTQTDIYTLKHTHTHTGRRGPDVRTGRGPL